MGGTDPPSWTSVEGRRWAASLRFRVDIFFFEWSENMTLACTMLFDKEVEPGLDSCLGLCDSHRGHLKSSACHLA